MARREDMDVSGFQGILVVHSLFVRGKPLPLYLHALEDDAAWDNLETSVDQAHENFRESRIVGQSMLYSLS